MQKNIAYKDILSGLQELGIQEGEIVCVHSSLSRFGYVQGGADTVIDALCTAVGENGTILAPAFTFSNEKTDDPCLDILNTPSEMGIISETIRKRSGKNRSPHLTHSISGIGKRANEYTCEHSLSPCGRESPFWKLIQENSSVVLLGVSLNSVTLFHAFEEHEEVPYVGFRDLNGTIIDVQGIRKSFKSQCHDNTKKYDFNPMTEPLQKEGILRQVIIGNSICRRIKADLLWEYIRPLMNDDPELLTLKTEEKTVIPVTINPE